MGPVSSELLCGALVLLLTALVITWPRKKKTDEEVIHEQILVLFVKGERYTAKKIAALFESKYERGMILSVDRISQHLEIMVKKERLQRESVPTEPQEGLTSTIYYSLKEDAAV